MIIEKELVLMEGYPWQDFKLAKTAVYIYRSLRPLTERL